MIHLYHKQVSKIVSYHQKNCLPGTYMTWATFEGQADILYSAFITHHTHILMVQFWSCLSVHLSVHLWDHHWAQTALNTGNLGTTPSTGVLILSKGRKTRFPTNHFSLKWYEIGLQLQCISNRKLCRQLNFCHFQVQQPSVTLKCRTEGRCLFLGGSPYICWYHLT